MTNKPSTVDISAVGEHVSRRVDPRSVHWVQHGHELGSAQSATSHGHYKWQYAWYIVELHMFIFTYNWSITKDINGKCICIGQIIAHAPLQIFTQPTFQFVVPLLYIRFAFKYVILFVFRLITITTKWTWLCDLAAFENESYINVLWHTKTKDIITVCVGILLPSPRNV